MAHVAIADEVIEHDHVPTSFISKYIWSQDHKVIAIQYSITAIFVGLVAVSSFRLNAITARISRFIFIY